MTASATTAASAIYVVHAASATAASPTIGDSISSGTWAFLGGIVGAVVAFGIAVIQQRAQNKRERTKIASDSASSHMANVAFDKYVQFCEAYAESATKAFDTLIAHGPTEKILKNASDLYQIRQKWFLWLTSETDAKLEKFEKSFREIGAKAGYVAATTQDSKADDRQKVLDEMYCLLAEVLGFKEWNGQKVSDEMTQSAFVTALRKMLGTEQFDTLRRAVISNAVKEFQHSDHM